MKSHVLKLISDALTSLNLPVEDLILTRPENPTHGTYTTNIAFILGQKQKTNPVQLAHTIVEKIRSIQSENIQDIHVAGPGFINIFLTPQSIVQGLNSTNKPNTGKKLVIEYTQPNPFKEMHIGHLYSNAVGESLSRLYEKTGWSVRRVNYQGDVGLHVGKSLWGLIQDTSSVHTIISQLESLSLDERIHYMGQAYAKGAAAYEEDEHAKEQIKQLNIMAFIAAQHLHKKQKNLDPIIDYTPMLPTSPVIDISQDDVDILYEHGRTWSLAYFEKRYDYLGTHFDGYYFESTIAEIGYKLVHEHIQDGVFEKDNGAIVYKGEKDGLHTRVFINSLGLPVYEAKDLGLAPTKYADDPYDLSIVETAKEIDEYFKVIIAALGKIYPELAQKTRHISHGIVKLPEGKMSSRTGKVKTTDWLITEVEQAVREVLSTTHQTFTEEEKEHVIHVLTVATIKYSFLKIGLPQDISFDIDHSVNLDGDSGPYLVYTYARCRSVLNKATTPIKISTDMFRTINLEETALLRHLLYFEEIVQESQEQNSPSTICRYSTDLAQLFNSFYAKHQIIQSTIDSEKQNTEQRLFLTQKTAETLKMGLYLLGIQTVEHM